MDRRTRWTAVPDEPPYPMNRRTRWTAVSDERPLRGFAGHFVRFGEEAKPAAPGQSQEWCQLAPPAPRCLSTPGVRVAMRRSRQHRLARHRPPWVPLLDDHESIKLAKVDMTAALGIAFAALPAIGAGA